MRAALTAWLVVSLLAHLATHVSITVGLARRKQYRRAVMGFLLSPFGALFGYEAGMKWRPIAWLVTLGAYALGVALA